MLMKCKEIFENLSWEEKIEDTLSPEESSSEHDGTEYSDTLNAFVSFSEGEMAQCPLSDSKYESGARRRLRFSESDDMVLLHKVAMLNPYKCSALWKEVTQVVALRAGKNFSVRSIRDHTDLLMNTYLLRGAEVCLKRTPPELVDKKKQLLHIVHTLWKKDSYSYRPTRSVAKKRVPDTSGEKQPKQHTQSFKKDSLEFQPSVNLSPLKVSAPRLTAPSHCNLSSVPLLTQQPKVPFTLHVGTAVQTLAQPPLLSGSSHPAVQSFSAVSAARIPSPPVSDLPSSVTGSSSLQAKLYPSRSCSIPDLVTDTTSSDEPVSLTTSPASGPDPLGPEVVDRCSSPIMSFGNCPVREKNLLSVQGNVQNASLIESVGSSTGSVRPESLALICRLQERKRRGRKISLVMRSRLDFLKVRHKTHFALRRKELALERRKIDLEERKLKLDEKKLQMDEERWQLEKKEREEKLLVMAEEREHKMAMERRQQNMIDVLLELKKKE